MTYPGGKNGSGVYQAIINLMPPHRVYIEPFLGGGAIMRLKRPAISNIGIDSDVDVVTQWQSSIPAVAVGAIVIHGDAIMFAVVHQARQLDKAFDRSKRHVTDSLCY